MGYITTLAYIDTAEDDHSLPDCDALNFPWPVVRNKQFKQIHSQSAEVSYSPKLGVSKFMVTRAAWGKRDRRSSNHGWSWILRLVFITYHLIGPNRILSGVRNVVYHFMRNGRNLFQFRNRDPIRSTLDRRCASSRKLAITSQPIVQETNFARI